MINKTIAKMLYYLGFKYCTSTNIAGGLTRGYGKLDTNGFWQFQLPYEWFDDKRKEF